MEKWFIKNKKADFSLIAKQFNISEILARLIVNRNISSNEELFHYMNPTIDKLHSPYTMKDIDKASDILVSKISERKKIRIVGDYDVDGVVSTYILYTALKKCGAEVDYEIPDRIKDGYGINKSIIDAAYQDGIDTILTCDNGIAAIDQISYAKELGMNIIITDHHDISFREEDGNREYIIPEADAVINPKQKDCNYPFKEICGAAVAYKLVEVLYDKFHIDKRETIELIEFVAIATVCDVMDLVDENRSIVKNGLEMINHTNHIGLKALIHESGLHEKELGVYHLGFVIGPCINASGRLDSAKIGLQLLLCNDINTATKLAQKLKTLNEERKDLTKEGVDLAIELIENSSIRDDKVIVVYLPDCHESLAGIIAGRVKEKYNKPTICLTKSENYVKGSARSIEEYNMFEELNNCKDLLIKFGGHPMAAGLSLDESNIDILRERINKNTALSEEDFIKKISFDMVLPFHHIDIKLINEIVKLEPYGKGNQKPLFAVTNVSITKATILGVNQNVLRLSVTGKDRNHKFTAMLFQGVCEFNEYIEKKYGDSELKAIYEGRENNVELDFIFYPEINEYKGYQNIQIMVQYYR